MAPPVPPRRPKVLVLGDDTRSFLAVVRSLGRRGIEVHAAWCSPRSAGCRSRYVARVHPLPPVWFGDEWLAPLEEVLRRERFDLVVALSDQCTIPLYRVRAQLEPLAPLALLDAGVYDAACDKARTVELAWQLDVPVPSTTIVRTPEALAGAIDGRSLPLVIKPSRSWYPDDLSQQHDPVLAFSEREAHSLCTDALRDGPVLVQERCAGVIRGLEVLADRGEIVLAFQHERLRAFRGGSSYRRSMSIDSRLAADAAKILDALSYTGVAMFEFIVDDRSGTRALLEINSRFWGSLPLALAAGVDFPYGLWQLLVLGRRPVQPPTYRIGMYARHLPRDLQWLLHRARPGNGDAGLSNGSAWKPLADLRNLVAGRERIDSFASDDPLPFAFELAQLPRQAAGALRVVARKSPNAA